MLKVLGQLMQCLLDFTLFFPQKCYFTAQFNRVSAEEQGPPQQFKKLLPHGEESPRFDS